MAQRIGWLDGKWGPSDQLTIPIIDQGLSLGHGIFETILILQGKPQLLSSHLIRWEKSALVLGMASPPKKDFISPLISDGIKRASLEKGNGAVRLNWTRGDNKKRGLNVSTKQRNETHRFWMDISHQEPSFKTISTIISRHEKRNAHSRLSVCKTFSYGQAIIAKSEAKAAGFDDALLLSTNGEICCGTTANLIIKRDNEFLTPEISSGCLPGIMREQGIKSGIFKEAALKSEAEVGDEWLLLNSLSCQPISVVNNKTLSVFPNAKDLWLSLLNA